MFGYALTSLPLLRAGLALGAVVPIALASDTLSIAVMEVVDNAMMLDVPGAMEAGLGDVLFWGALSFALGVAGAVALPVNRWLLARGRGHAAVHRTGIHGGPSPGSSASPPRRSCSAPCWPLRPLARRASGHRARGAGRGTGRSRRNPVTLVAMSDTLNPPTTSRAPLRARAARARGAL